MHQLQEAGLCNDWVNGDGPEGKKGFGWAGLGWHEDGRKMEMGGQRVGDQSGRERIIVLGPGVAILLTVREGEGRRERKGDRWVTLIGRSIITWRIHRTHSMHLNSPTHAVPAHL